jgi:hypothetical protein
VENRDGKSKLKLNVDNEDDVAGVQQVKGTN